MWTTTKHGTSKYLLVHQKLLNTSVFRLHNIHLESLPANAASNLYYLYTETRFLNGVFKIFDV